MTVRMLEKEAMELPPESRVRLAEKIMESIDDFTAPELQGLWDEEIQARVGSINSGAEKGIPAEEVAKRARRAVNETRRISSARRK